MKKILHLKRQLLELGLLHPGSLSRQYRVCGKAGCKCVAPEKPRPKGRCAHSSRFYLLPLALEAGFC